MKKIITDSSKCTQCYNCQMVCSLVYEGSCNPEKARILITPGTISFTDECVEGCSLCTQYCAREAIKAE